MDQIVPDDGLSLSHALISIFTDKKARLSAIGFTRVADIVKLADSLAQPGIVTNPATNGSQLSVAR